MKLKRIRTHQRRSRWMEGIFEKNPVLICGLALPFAIMITYNLKNSVFISILFACSLLPSMLLSCLIGKYLAEWLSPILYALFSLVLVAAALPLIQPISPEVVDSLGIYVPILSVNTVMLTLCARNTNKELSPLIALADAVSYSLGFTLALCLVGSVREIIGNGTIWGAAVKLPFKTGGIQIAFFGFILVALFAALFRSLRRIVLFFLYRHENPAEEDSPL